MPKTELEADLRLALELADLADAISTRYFQSDQLVVETKPDLSPVTRADREVELAIRQRLAEARPDHAVLGEEFGAQPASSGVRWIVDPIDGTKRYVRGVPLFATLLAQEREGEIVVGVASAPAFGRRWWAARGLGAFADGRRIQVSRVQQLGNAHVCHASLDSWLARSSIDHLANIARRAWSTTGYGDFWAHLLVAEGAVDAALEPQAEVWDLAPLKIIVEEAGGCLTDFSGEATAYGKNAVSSNGGPLHAEVLGLLSAT
jgi:histidinol-phosphatase